MRLIIIFIMLIMYRFIFWSKKCHVDCEKRSSYEWKKDIQLQV